MPKSHAFGTACKEIRKIFQNFRPFPVLWNCECFNFIWLKAELGNFVQFCFLTGSGSKYSSFPR